MIHLKWKMTFTEYLMNIHFKSNLCCSIFSFFCFIFSVLFVCFFLVLFLFGPLYCLSFSIYGFLIIPFIGISNFLNNDFFFHFPFTEPHANFKTVTEAQLHKKSSKIIHSFFFLSLPCLDFT